MREHDIFTFTSNKREGWGAVLNEAMSCGCACVVSDLIGAAPYLIKAGINGYTFKTGDVCSFVSCVQKLIDCREKEKKFNIMLIRQCWIYGIHELQRLISVDWLKVSYVVVLYQLLKVHVR